MSLNIARLRLRSQQLTGTAFTRPEEIVRWFGAVQAQEYALSKWALGLRQPLFRDADVEQAFSEGRILRTHLLRPTWHFVAAEDIRWMLQLTAPHVQAGNAYMYRQTELDAGTLKRCNDLIIKSLQGKKQLTRPQIGELLKNHKIIAGGMRLSYIMMNAELEGIVCSGARQGARFTYALLEERVAPAPALSRDEALDMLTARYFASRGPATIADFTTWSGLSVKDGKAGIAMRQERLECVRFEGQTYYLAGSEEARIQSPTIWLLPPYDEYIMGYKNREAIMQLRAGTDSLPGLFDSMIICNGQVAGTWRRKVSGKKIDLEYHFFRTNKMLVKAFEKAVARFETFAGMPVVYNRNKA